MSELPECCRTGFLHEGTPTGTTEKLHGLDVYVARPVPENEKPKKAVVIYSDVFGWELVNLRLIADSFAKAGYTAYLPDFFTGTAISVEGRDDLLDYQQPKTFGEQIKRGLAILKVIPSGIPFMARNGDSKIVPLGNAFLGGLKNDGYDIGVVGYCWGGRYTILQSHGDLIKCFVAAHPSRVSVPADIHSITKPGLFLCAEYDNVFSAADRKTSEEILEEKVKTGNGPAYKFVCYEGMAHGFAVRGNDKDEKVQKARKDAFEQCVAWYNQHL
ncbi:uncharacterized protein SPPG_06719 [Spizellomyces punctatus DAOM BR117]|uniref:Dienelactone hydrolase domain-containing protein n=1 Tax=Spizellomyces punctatus (strain DAOM BR117) TaxID=645134 RepID=A0A0L0HBK6_SPIPD|nr:uncharacterized protein SPPG_06719 [Spizellomyces punctatus DAOM BR117]KNC98326.1 hypothetical protein SPPG_06719 [Spizellomyces punctatus DAOM BR117]|eukprot:XP_016606366.1 hypothetical protein SPPG_06719 [Spizellomyces punctatus DAOM BR117]